MFKRLYGTRCPFFAGMRVLISFYLLLGSFFAGAVHADDFLPPEKAFKFSAYMAAPTTAVVHFEIARGYYMYREQFAFTSDSATLGEAILPPGVVQFDETFQKDVETYRRQLMIEIPVSNAERFTLRVRSQGCADAGLCYVPMESAAHLDVNVVGGSSGNVGGGLLGLWGRMVDALDSELGAVESSLASGRILLIAPLFFILGLGLSLTPCVLPMLPILSSIILGEGTHVSRSRGLLLSATYGLGMALVYTALGVAAGLAGEGLAIALQTPLVVGAFAVLVGVLALSMFGVFQFQMPAFVQEKLMRASGNQRAGKLVGVFAMGAISALIVGPCVAAPLAGALMYISQTRDMVVGGMALFAMATGMSVPLLLLGISAGTVLPRAGAWMNGLKVFFGVLMLAQAVWMVSPFIPAIVAKLAWAALAVVFGAYLLRAQSGWRPKLLASAFLMLGAVQLVNVVLDERALNSFANESASSFHGPTFERIGSVAELDHALARADGRFVMLDFYADWCVSCIEMERFTFSKPEIKSQLEEMLLLQVDVTALNDDHRALLRRYKLFGPPAILFFNPAGGELEKVRVIGYQNARKFGATLERVKRNAR